jgi:hypothetical protein
MSALARRPGRWPAALLASFAAFLFQIGAAFAHGAERGFVMLLPTGHFVAGGVLAVGISFLAATALPRDLFLRIAAFRLPVTSFVPRNMRLLSCLSAGLLLLLIIAGFMGTRDPLSNPLPLAIWTVWWVLVVLLHPIAGNIWALLNPFTGPYAAASRVLGHRVMSKIRVHPPPGIAYAPACLIFFAFAWFQLVAPAPDDPQRLAVAVCVYAAFTFAAIFLTGPERWLSEGDPFAIYFRLLAAAAPLQIERDEMPRRRLSLQLAGVGLAEITPLPPWGVLFVLLTLSAVSFDGFANTFFWLSLAGINPLEFPGRTAVILSNSLGLLEAFACLSTLFLLAVFGGWLWAGRPGNLGNLTGQLVLSLIPISIAFHFAHYLPDLLINGQYALLALNDPLFIGWNLIGLGNYHVTASFLNSKSGAETIYFLQTAAIVAGHIVGVMVAHLILLGTGTTEGALIRIELPFALLMVAFTAFGLWILSTPSIG